jgi:hypothetical protein
MPGHLRLEFTLQQTKQNLWLLASTDLQPMVTENPTYFTKKSTKLLKNSKIHCSPMILMAGDFDAILNLEDSSNENITQDGLLNFFLNAGDFILSIWLPEPGQNNIL